MCGFFKKWKKKEQPVVRVEREVWYDLVTHMRAWDTNWINFLEDTDPRRPMTKDEFIDKMIKRYKISDRQEKHT